MITELEKYKTTDISKVKTWFKAAAIKDIPENGGACVRVNDLQIAIFYFARRNEWYACQNLCPHKMQMSLARGIIGSEADDPKVACPFHKKTFSLKSGNNLNGEDYKVAVYPVKTENGHVFIGMEDY